MIVIEKNCGGLILILLKELLESSLTLNATSYELSNSEKNVAKSD